VANDWNPLVAEGFSSQAETQELPLNRVAMLFQAGPAALVLALALAENPVRWVDSSPSAVALIG
jgi:hypothetical protein